MAHPFTGYRDLQVWQRSMVLAAQPMPLTHDLEERQRLGMSLVPTAPPSGLDLTELTQYAVQIRYDCEFWPDRDTTESAPP
jgi:hypothetical protein